MRWKREAKKWDVRREKADLIWKVFFFFQIKTWHIRYTRMNWCKMYTNPHTHTHLKAHERAFKRQTKHIYTFDSICILFYCSHTKRRGIISIVWWNVLYEINLRWVCERVRSRTRTRTLMFKRACVLYIIYIFAINFCVLKRERERESAQGNYGSEKIICVRCFFFSHIIFSLFLFCSSMKLKRKTERANEQLKMRINNGNSCTECDVWHFLWFIIFIIADCSVCCTVSIRPSLLRCSFGDWHKHTNFKCVEYQNNNKRAEKKKKMKKDCKKKREDTDRYGWMDGWMGKKMEHKMILKKASQTCEYQQGKHTILMAKATSAGCRSIACRLATKLILRGTKPKCSRQTEGERGNNLWRNAKQKEN